MSNRLAIEVKIYDDEDGDILDHKMFNIRGSTRYEINELLKIIEKLAIPHLCPWENEC